MYCKNCKYADISSGTRVIERGGVTFIQSGNNNVFCTCKAVKNITITDGIMACSSFVRKEVKE